MATKKAMKTIKKLPYVIVRTYSAGVFAGRLASRKGQEAVVLDARRLWRWAGAASLSQLAMEGTNNPRECKFPCPVGQVELTQVVEIDYCTAVAEKSLREVPEWEA